VDDGSSRVQRKAERRERQRDDPYYVDDNEDDVDAIPVVQLDLTGLTPPPSARPSSTRRTSSSSRVSKPPKPKPPRPPTPPPVFVDVDGELPPETLQRATQPVSAPPPPTHEAEPSVEDLPAPTVDVKVVKIKKKDRDGAAKGTKRKTKKTAEGGEGQPL
jgi:AP-3 complex subunit delta-1